MYRFDRQPRTMSTVVAVDMIEERTFPSPDVIVETLLVGHGSYEWAPKRARGGGRDPQGVSSSPSPIGRASASP